MVVPEEAAAVRLAFEQYATGLQSLMGLAELLNARGYHTHPSAVRPSAGAAVFERQSVGDAAQSVLHGPGALPGGGERGG